MSAKHPWEYAEDCIYDILYNYSAEVFTGHDGDYWIWFIDQGKQKTMSIKSRQWKRWLARNFSANSEQVLKRVVLDLPARATGEETKRVNVRVARTHNSIQIDLGDDSCDVVHVLNSQNGFKIAQPSNVYFCRSTKQRPLPRPIPIDRTAFLRMFQNLIPELEVGHWLLALAFVLIALDRESGSYPILVIEGVQGVGKTMLSRRLKSLIDPTEPSVLSSPQNINDIIGATLGAHLLVFDNISGLSHRMADHFCRLATGVGILMKKNSMDRDDSYYNLHSPSIINGISEPSNRPDFNSRCIKLELKSIQSRRGNECELNKEFQANHPALLGGIYSLLADCMRILPTIKEKELPRMTDYARMGIAIEKALKLPSGTFLKVYNDNLSEQTDSNFWNDSLCNAIFEKLEKTSGRRIEGTAHELKNILLGPSRTSSPFSNGKSFAESLRRIEPLLKIKGIVIERLPRSAHKRLIVIRFENATLSPGRTLGFDDEEELDL